MIVWHASGVPDPGIVSALESCGVRLHMLPVHGDVNAVYSGHCSVAVVSADRVSAATALTLAVVATLKDQGFTVIVRHADPEALPLALRCRLILAGCSVVLDGRHSAAADELRRHVLEGVWTGLEQHKEETTFAQQMRDLGIVGRSRPMIEIFRRVKRLTAATDLPVLITGETGTGKELLARALHTLDAGRTSGPFVAVNCGAVSPALAESELFGHRRGAFTGADREREGLVRSANGGVLFLDEIAEMPAGLQPKLLRVLQENKVLAVGDDREVPISVRVIAATNRDLSAMVDERAFRGDLFHRLNVLSIDIPPLRSRREDIPPLVEHFMRKHGALRGDAPAPTASTEFLDVVSRLDLPGNARQLENLVRWALVHHDGRGTLRLRDLPPAVLTQVLHRDVSPPATSATTTDAAAALAGAQAAAAGGSSCFPARVLATHDWNLSRTLRYCERSILEIALKEACGNHSRAARLLGITPRSVYNKVRRHRL